MDDLSPPASSHDIALQVSSHTATAEFFARQGNFPAAENLYTQALTLKPSDTHLLLCRSRCRILGGRPLDAITDAQTVLSTQSESTRAMLCLADAYFSSGDFELALIWYTRGEKLSDRGDEFRRGMLRCTEIIEEIIENVDMKQLKDHCAKEKERLKSIKRQKNDDKGRPTKSMVKSSNDISPAHMVPQPPQKPRHSQSRREQHSRNTTTDHPVATSKDSPASIRTRNSIADQHLLEELYDDYLFLKDLAADPVMQRAADGSVHELVQSGISYLEARRDFWQARNPQGDNHRSKS